MASPFGADAGEPVQGAERFRGGQSCGQRTAESRSVRDHRGARPTIP